MITDNKSYLPHVSILSSLNEDSLNDSQINYIKDQFGFFNRNFRLSKINIGSSSML